MRFEADHPTFCIVTPTVQGRRRLLKAAIDSVKAQTYKNYMHVVCADGDAPESEALCKDEGVIFDKIEKMGNWGYGVRNHVVQKYDADYFMFLDDDNIYKPECLDVLSKELGPPFISFQIDFIARWMTPTQRWNIPWGPEITKGNFDQMCMCIRSEVAKQVQFQKIYEQDFQYATDCAKIAGSVRFVPKVLGVYSWSWEQDNGKRED